MNLRKATKLDFGVHAQTSLLNFVRDVLYLSLPHLTNSIKHKKVELSRSIRNTLQDYDDTMLLFFIVIGT